MLQSVTRHFWMPKFLPLRGNTRFKHFAQGNTTFWMKNCIRAGPEKMRRHQCNAFYHISAYKSTYGQDRTIALIHMLSSNKSNIWIFTFPCLLWYTTLEHALHWGQGAWHKKPLHRAPLEWYISKAIHNRHGKVYIKTFRNVGTLEMCECYSCTLDTGGVTGWKQKCSMTSQKGFIFSEPANSCLLK